MREAPSKSDGRPSSILPLALMGVGGGLALLLLVVFLIKGSGGSKMPPLNTVTGSVKRGSDGVANAMVILVPENSPLAVEFTMSGLTDDRGTVEIQTIERKTNRKRS